MTAVLDYGVGNIRSVSNAFEHLGEATGVTADPNAIGRADRLILPGVGAFGVAMQRLRPLAEAVSTFVASGRPLLGICLGQQLLFDTSEEQGLHTGLGILKGSVARLAASPGLRVPHMGWNSLDNLTGSLFKNVAEGDQVYFAHSYICKSSLPAAATTTYGVSFPSAFEIDNVFAVQFHPEKSGAVGLQILSNFLEC